MLDILSDGFKSAKQKLSGKATLTEENVAPAIDAIRKSLLEADVDYDVSKNFLQRLRDRAVGQEVQLRAGKGEDKRRLSPGDHFVRICQEELENLMGPTNSELVYAKNRPTVVMMVGLQGAGKTTSTGKLTKYLMREKQRKPLLVAADIYRPAAVEQLKVLGKRLGVPVFHQEGATPVTICQSALKQAEALHCDTVIFDTAGRLAIDQTLMQELSDIKSATKPDNILLVCDAMIGQDAVRTAKTFDERLDLSGVIITKLDGDARGGAALSIKEVTGKTIKFVGNGEDLDRLEEFRPDGMATRILGMGDILGLVKDFERVSEKDHEEDALRMLQGQFTFRDFYEQISMIQKMGSLKDIVAKLPMQGMIPKDANVDDRELGRIKAMIDSMTEQERVKPSVFNSGRVRRIAKGSGRSEKDVNELVKKFSAMRQMMGGLGKSMGLLGKIPGMGALGQMRQMQQMAQNMMAGGGMPGLGGLGGMFGGGGASMGGARAPNAAERDKLREKRKAAKKARKKNRR